LNFYKENAMQMTFTLPNELAQQIQALPDRDNFVREVLQVAMQQRANPPLSKWAKMAKRIEENAIELGDYTDKFKQDMRDF
jgi:hypothetical protein